jgi:hypothetical protein
MDCLSPKVCILLPAAAAPDGVARLIAGTAPPHDLGPPLLKCGAAVRRHNHVKLLRQAVQHPAGRVCRTTI